MAGLFLVAVLVFFAAGGPDRCGSSLLPEDLRLSARELLAAASDWDAELRGGDSSETHFHDGMEMRVADGVEEVDLSDGGTEVRVALAVTNTSDAVRPTRLMRGWLRYAGADGGLSEAPAPATGQCAARSDIAPKAEAEVLFCFRVPEGAPGRFDDLVVRVGPVATLVFEP